MVVEKTQPTFAEVLAKHFPERRGSISKRSRHELENEASVANNCPKDNSDLGPFTTRAFEHWSLVTEVMSQADIVFNKAHPNHAVFESVKQVLNSASGLQFAMANELDMLKKKGNDQGSVIDKHTEVLDKNRAGGNIVTNVERSTAYQKSCEEMKNSGTLCKVLNIDFGTELKNSSEITTKAKEILNSNNDIKGVIQDAQVIPLGKATTLRDGKHSIPILIKTQTKENRDKVEKEIKKAGYSSAYHWPKNALSHITSMRNQLKTFKNDTIDLTEKQIMIRPVITTGKKLNIYYREINTSKWNLLETVNTPVNNELLSQFKGEQICKSNYFIL